MSHALNGLALLADDPAQPVRRRGRFRLRVPDWLPALLNAGRAFVMIGAAAVFWVITVWPSGALAMTWTAIGVILFAPRADEAYTSTLGFMIGTGLVAHFCCDHRVRGLAELGDFFRPRHRDRSCSGACRDRDGAAVADHDVHWDGGEFHSVARAG